MFKPPVRRQRRSSGDWSSICFPHKSIIHPSSAGLIRLRFCRGNINTTASAVAGGWDEMAEITVIKCGKWGETKTNTGDVRRRYALLFAHVVFFYSSINICLVLFCRGDNVQQSPRLPGRRWNEMKAYWCWTCSCRSYMKPLFVVWTPVALILIFMPLCCNLCHSSGFIVLN